MEDKHIARFPTQSYCGIRADYAFAQAGSAYDTETEKPEGVCSECWRHLSNEMKERLAAIRKK